MASTPPRRWRRWLAEQVPDPQARRYRAGAAVRDLARDATFALRGPHTATPARVTRTADTLERHLAAVAGADEALAAAGVPRFAYSDSGTRVRLGVRRRDQAAALAALHRWGSARTAVVAVPTEDGVRGVASLDRDLPGRVRDAAAIVVGLPVTDPGHRLVLGIEEGVRVDWWDEAADDSLAATSPNRWAQRLPMDVQQPLPLRFHGLTVPSFGVLTDPHVDDVLAPVDAVVTWVDSADPAWRERYLAAGGRDLGDERHASRYRSLDELRYTLRGLATFAPWLRRLFLVTDDQRPTWLREDDRLTVVDHRELWPDGDALPVYNSHAIEARLHHIPGLAEQWLYVNDDVIVGRTVTPERFFTPGGQARFFPSDLHVGFGAALASDGTPSLAGRTSRALLAAATGRVQTRKLAHTPHPQLQAVANDLEARFPADYERTWRSRFRAADDVAPVTLQTWYGFATGRFVPGHLAERYYDLRTQALGAKLRYLARHRHLDTFCLNMGEEEGEDLVRNEAVVAAFLASYLPFSSPWEADT